MNDTVLGALLLHLVGVGLLTSAVSSGPFRPTPGPRWRPGVVVNALVGGLAVGDAAVAVADEPVRVVLWAVGAGVALLAAAAVVWRHRAARRRPVRVTPEAVVPRPRPGAAYIPLTSGPT